IRDLIVTGVQTCALPIYADGSGSSWSTQPWYLYFPDGRRVASNGLGGTDLYDPNGNRIRFLNSCADFPTCTQPYSLILDSSNHRSEERRVGKSGVLDGCS